MSAMRERGLGEERVVACIGAGVIGSAWAALFAARGCRVTVQDPSEVARARIDATAARVAGLLGMEAREVRARLSFTTNLEEALADAEFVQESAPESLELKRQLLPRIAEIAPPDAIIASSTSDYPISLVQPLSRHPERLLVGHPLNPPYAIPLVEVVGGEATSEEAIARACAFYRSVGQKPLRLGHETTGFLANRLQMAVAREALQLVARGEATIAEIDEALQTGIGPRFAAVGLFGGYILNVPDHDPDQWLEHIAAFDFGAELVHRDPFPEWTPELREKVASQWRQRIGNDGAAALLDRRDRLSPRIAALASPAGERPSGPHPSFAADYQDAREKFLDAAAGANAFLEHHCLPGHDGPDGRPLYMDCAWLGPRNADVVVLSLSGTHGAEGFSGSAAQTHWLRTEGAEPLPPGVAMLFIHAVNPFGFAHTLRVNENNVNVNRNFIDFTAPPPANPLYDMIAAGLPKRIGLDEALVDEWNTALDLARARHGEGPASEAISCGQYSDPSGIEYGGDRLQWSSSTVIDIVTRLCARSRHVVYIDWHSLIPIGDGNLIFLTANAKGDSLYRRSASWWGEAAIDQETVGSQWASGTSAPRGATHGTLMWGLQRALAPRTDLAGALVEFCCDPDSFANSSEPDTRTTMWERWLYATRAHTQPAGRPIVQYLREAASPTRRSYQDSALAAAMPVYRQAIAGAARWAGENVSAECGRLIQSDAGF